MGVGYLKKKRGVATSYPVEKETSPRKPCSTHGKIEKLRRNNLNKTRGVSNHVGEGKDRLSVWGGGMKATE